MRQFGYTVITSPEGKKENDLFTCGHCQKVVTFEPGELPEDAGGLCKVCNRLICKACHGLGKCEPFERKLERMEARAAFFRSSGI